MRLCLPEHVRQCPARAARALRATVSCQLAAPETRGAAERAGRRRHSTPATHAWCLVLKAAEMTPAIGRQGVAAAVAASFAAAAGDTLDTLRRTESSLRRLKKTRAAEGGAGDAGALSDVDKVGRQLLLDAQARPRLGSPARQRRGVLVPWAVARGSALPRRAAGVV